MRFCVLLLILVLASLSLAVLADDSDPTRVSEGLLAWYTFEPGQGDVIQDRSNVGGRLDLTIQKPASVNRSDGVLRVNSETVIRSERPATKIIDALKRSNAVTIEAWIRPENVKQKGPARVVSLSANASVRNFTLGQDGDRYDVRLRTTSTSENGTPSTAAPKKSASTSLAHVVFTRAADGKVRFFVNGEEVESKRVDGDFATWSEDFRLSLANESTGGRPWLGEIHLVAIYQRALDSREVVQNFQAGSRAGVDPDAAEKLARARAEAKFATRVAPIFAKRCVECHDTAARKGGLDLSKRVEAVAGGESGLVIVPSQPDESLLWDQVVSGDMPPQGPPLSETELTTLRDWIEEGAVWSVELIDPAVYSANPGASQAWVQRLTVDEYIETVRSTVEVDIAEEARQILPADLRADGFSNTAYNLNVDLKHVEAYARLARMIVERMNVLEFASRFSKHQSLNTDASARKFVAAVGEWLLRGPLDEREVTNYSGILTAVASAGGDFEQGVTLMVEAMLQSPRFIYRMEDQQGTGQRHVNSYELASRMSYIIWGGPPDAELYKAAREGRLFDTDGCQHQIERMLADSRAVSRSKQFIAEWLNLDRLENMQPSEERYPQWEPALGLEMREETLRFFEEVVWKQGGPLTALFNAQFTVATPRLAEHYGLSPQGDGWQRYDLSGVSSRGGLLTQGSVLTIGGDDASMVTRGLFVLRDVLRGVIGAPPPGVDTTPVPAKPGMTLRDIAQQRIENVACGGCHKKFEPLAFGLEQFDGLGVFREQDEFGNALRADGELIIPGEAEPVTYQTSAELMDALAASDRVRLTMTWKLTQFALGRPLGPADAIDVQQIHDSAKKSGGTYPDLMKAIIMSDLVQKVRLQN